MEGKGKPSFKGLSNRLALNPTLNPYKSTRHDKLRGFYRTKGPEAKAGGVVVVYKRPIV